MKYVPHWVIDALLSKKFKCHNCKKVFTYKNVRGLGIRESHSETDKEHFFLELECVECRKITFFEMQEMNIVDLSEEILAEIDADLDAMEAAESKDIDMSPKMKKKLKEEFDEMPKKNCKTQKKETSKITLKDIRETVKALKPKELHHECFLEMMGMSPEEISLYREKE
jgi:hypothetical protein